MLTYTLWSPVGAMFVSQTIQKLASYHSVDSGQSADWWRLLQKSGKSADSTQMHGRDLRGFGWVLLFYG